MPRLPRIFVSTQKLLINIDWSRRGWQIRRVTHAYNLFFIIVPRRMTRTTARHPGLYHHGLPAHYHIYHGLPTHYDYHGLLTASRTTALRTRDDIVSPSAWRNCNCNLLYHIDSHMLPRTLQHVRKHNVNLASWVFDLHGAI